MPNVPRPQLFGHQVHDQRVGGIEADAKTLRRRSPIAQNGPHYRVLVRRVGCAEKVAQFVHQDLQPFRFADVPRRFANENVRGQRAVRATEVHLAVDPFIVAREPNGHPRRERPYFCANSMSDWSNVGRAGSDVQWPTATTSNRTRQWCSKMSEASTKRLRIRFSQTAWIRGSAESV